MNDVNLTVIPVALGTENTSVDLAVGGEDPGAGEHTLASDNFRDTIEVEMMDGDSIPAQYDIPSPSIVKIDVEGAELEVLKGLSKLLSGCRLIYCEVHPDRLDHFGADVDEVESFIESQGFECTRIGERKNEYFLRGVAIDE